MSYIWELNKLYKLTKSKNFKKNVKDMGQVIPNPSHKSNYPLISPLMFQKKTQLLSVTLDKLLKNYVLSMFPFIYFIL